MPLWEIDIYWHNKFRAVKAKQRRLHVGRNSFDDSGEYELNFTSNRIVSKDFALLFSGRTHDRKSACKNELGDGGGGLEAENSNAAKFSAKWRLSDAIDFTVRYTRQEDDGGHMASYLPDSTDNDWFLDTYSGYCYGLFGRS